MYNLTLPIETDNGTEEVKFLFELEKGERPSCSSPGYADEIIDLEWQDCSAEANEFIKNEIDWIEDQIWKYVEGMRKQAEEDRLTHNLT